ncbi:MAG: hypothetical protein KY453_12570 [Gemmatimonadetes bacterium]|nr:hypothetical protein [Gemmatimonadota bacterium]
MKTEGAEALFHELRLGAGTTTGLPLTLRVVGSADPGVLERFVSDDDDVPVQVVTAFRALPEPAASYPAGIPFVPDVPVFVTEFPEEWRTPCARWLVRSREGGVFERVVASCVAGGWMPVEGMGELLPFPGRRLVLRRRGEAWLVLVDPDLAELGSLDGVVGDRDLVALAGPVVTDGQGVARGRRFVVSGGGRDVGHVWLL